MGIDTGLTAALSSNRQTGIDTSRTRQLERETGIEPVSLAWKAKVLPLNYSRPGALPIETEMPTTKPASRPDKRFAWWRRLDSNQRRRKPTDLQSAPFSHSGTPPRRAIDYSTALFVCNDFFGRGVTSTASDAGRQQGPTVGRQTNEQTTTRPGASQPVAVARVEASKSPTHKRHTGKTRKQKW